MRKLRQLHLWIGMICSVLIFIQSLTGLLLSESQWFSSGESERRGNPPAVSAGAAGAGPASSDSARNGAFTEADSTASASLTGPSVRGGQGEGNSFQGFVKGLHEGKIGNMNVKWLVDITAIGTILLTGTGVALSIKTLRAQSIQNKRRRLATQTTVSRT